MPNALAGARRRRARRDVRPDPPCSTWRSSPSGRRPPRSIDIDAPVDREHGRGGQGQAARRPTHGVHPRPPAARELVAEVRGPGARIKFISDGDVAGAIIAARGTGIDMLLGIGGTPEGIIAACAMKCHGGAMQAGCGPATKPSAARPSTPATTWTGCCTPTTWSRGDNVFFVRHRHHRRRTAARRGYRPGGRAAPQSIVMRSRSGTIRSVQQHPLPRQGRPAQLIHPFVRERTRTRSEIHLVDRVAFTASISGRPDWHPDATAEPTPA